MGMLQEIANTTSTVSAKSAKPDSGSGGDFSNDSLATGLTNSFSVRQMRDAVNATKADARRLNNDSVKLNEALARATVGPTRELFRRIGEQQRDLNEIFFMAHALIHPKVMAAEVAQATGSRAKILAQNRTYSAPAALFGLINAT